MRRINPACRLLSAVCLAALLVGCDQATPKPKRTAVSKPPKATPVTKQQRAHKETVASPIVAAARTQIGKTVVYDPAYVKLDYPGGDVPIERGVCTDVIIRALRTSRNLDLQKLVHEDMRTAFSKYPTIWGLKKPDRNIDHRRVPNLRRYFERKGYSVAITRKKEDYLPGDIVTCTVGRNLPHIMIVSDRKARDGAPLVIHNIGSGTREEDRLFDFRITGHYRIK